MISPVSCCVHWKVSSHEQWGQRGQAYGGNGPGGHSCSLAGATASILAAAQGCGRVSKCHHLPALHHGPAALCHGHHIGSQVHPTVVHNGCVCVWHSHTSGKQEACSGLHQCARTTDWLTNVIQRRVPSMRTSLPEPPVSWLQIFFGGRLWAVFNFGWSSQGHLFSQPKVFIVADIVHRISLVLSADSRTNIYLAFIEMRNTLMHQTESEFHKWKLLISHNLEKRGKSKFRKKKCILDLFPPIAGLLTAVKSRFSPFILWLFLLNCASSPCMNPLDSASCWQWRTGLRCLASHSSTSSSASCGGTRPAVALLSVTPSIACQSNSFNVLLVGLVVSSTWFWATPKNEGKWTTFEQS